MLALGYSGLQAACAAIWGSYGWPEKDSKAPLVGKVLLFILVSHSAVGDLRIPPPSLAWLPTGAPFWLFSLPPPGGLGEVEMANMEAVSYPPDMSPL